MVPQNFKISTLFLRKMKLNITVNINNFLTRETHEMIMMLRIGIKMFLLRLDREFPEMSAIC